MDNFKRRRLNTQILTKTQIALEAIKRYDMAEQARSQAILQKGNTSNKLISDLDYHYSKLTSHKPFKLDHKHKIHLFAHSEQFYVLPMRNYIFPMKVLVRNVKNEGTLYVGYDRQHPGIPMESKQVPFQSQTNIKTYDSKTTVNRDLFVILKNKGNRQISNVYFTIVAGRQLFMCDILVQFLGLRHEDRVFSESKIVKQSRLLTEPQNGLNSQTVPVNRSQRVKTDQSTMLKNMSHKEFVRSKVTLDKLERPVRIEEFNLMGQLELIKHHSKSQESLAMTRQKFGSKNHSKGYHPESTIRNDSFGIRTIHPKIKSDVDFKIEEVKRNKEMLEAYKTKQKELKQTASKCKRMIEGYKKIFRQETVRKKKLNVDLVILLSVCRFASKVSEMHQNRISAMAHQIRTDFLCKRFVTKLQKSFGQTCSLVPTRKGRYMSQGDLALALMTKMIHKHTQARAQSVLIDSFAHLYPVLLVRHSMVESNKYRLSIRLIQKVWKIKYHGRMYCLLYFVDNHVEKMLVQYPHFKMFFEDFYKSKSNRAICLDYIKDQSQKYRYIYEAYKHKLEEISEMQKVNIEEMTKSKRKGERQLKVPKRPVKPMHRFYRNSDILKSMVRTWFEIQYKKYQKKSAKQLKGY